MRFCWRDKSLILICPFPHSHLLCQRFECYDVRRQSMKKFFLLYSFCYVFFFFSVLLYASLSSSITVNFSPFYSFIRKEFNSQRFIMVCVIFFFISHRFILHSDFRNAFFLLLYCMSVCLERIEDVSYVSVSCSCKSAKKHQRNILG